MKVLTGATHLTWDPVIPLTREYKIERHSLSCTGCCPSSEYEGCVFLAPSRSVQLHSSSEQPYLTVCLLQFAQVCTVVSYVSAQGHLTLSG